MEFKRSFRLSSPRVEDVKLSLGERGVVSANAKALVGCDDFVLGSLRDGLRDRLRLLETVREFISEDTADEEDVIALRHRVLVSLFAVDEAIANHRARDIAEQLAARAGVTP